MADAYTTTASLTSDQAAYERYAYFALRPELYFDQLADVKPTRQSMPGNSVIFTKYTEMSEATTALNESVDVDAVALADAQVTVTLVEHGNAAVTTAKLRGGSFLEVDRDAANLIGFNAGISLDSIARTPLVAGTNVIYSGNATARNTVGPDDTLSSGDVREARARLAANNVQRWSDGSYKAVIHPDAALDLRAETDLAGWRAPNVHGTDQSKIWNGSIGIYEGFEFLESPRAFKIADAGSSTTLTDVYVTLFMGRQAIAKAYSSREYGPLPSVVHGLVTDKLQRFHPIGWKWLGGYGRFREEALYRVESASSIGTNA